MTRQEIIDIFVKTNALLYGHFLLTSGKHSDQYFQCAKVLQYPEYTEKIVGEIAAGFSNVAFDTVIAPAMGGILVGYEFARQTGKRFIFAEREENKMVLRRGFSISEGERILICEDVVTTGGSVREVIEIVKRSNAEITGIAAIVDRSGGEIDFGYKFVAALQLEAKTYEPDACPLCVEKQPLVKPGSRKFF